MRRSKSHRTKQLIDLSCRSITEALEPRRLLCSLPIEHREDIPDLVEDVWIVDGLKTTNYFDGKYNLLHSTTEPFTATADRSASEGNEAASIVWVNRGISAGANDDRFSSVFGGNANAARAVMDAAIEQWRRVIGDFNYSDGSDGFSLTVRMASSGTSLGASANVSSWLNGKPKAGSITMGRGSNGSGSGWFLDPTPFDHSEFNGTIVNAFAGDAPVGSPARNLSDFLTVANLEIAHTVGLFTAPSAWNGFNIDLNVNDAAGGATGSDLYRFNGSTIRHLNTEFDSGAGAFGSAVHTAEPQSVTVSGVVYNGAQDAGNAYYEGSRRYLVPETLRLMFDESLNYSTVPAAQFGSMYAILDQSTGVLTVRGGDSHDANVIDRITINRSGSTFTVSVDPDIDVPGTGSLPGAGDLGAWTTNFNAADVNSIVIDTGGGNDVITINGLPSGTPVTINAGSGNDTVSVGGGDFDTNVSSNITYNGGSGTNRLVINDVSDGLGSDSHTLNPGSYTKSVGDVITFDTAVTEIILNASGQADAIAVTGIRSGNGATINGGDGNDTITLADDYDSNFDGNLLVQAQGGTDLVIIDDTGDSINDTYQISGNSFSKPGFNTSTVTFGSTTEQLRVLGSSWANTWSVPQVSSWLSLDLRGGTANDTFRISDSTNNFDSNILANVTVRGGTGSNSLILNESSAAAGTYTITNTTFRKADSVLTYEAITNFNFVASSGADTIVVTSVQSETPLTLNGGNGNDTLRVNDATSFLFNFGNDIDFTGGAGTDTIAITDEAFAGTGTYQINSSNVLLPFNAAIVFHNTVEALSVFGSGGNNTFTVNSAAIRTSINGGNGDDSILTGGSNVAAVVTNYLQVVGGGGADTFTVNDQLAGAGVVYNYAAASMTRTGMTGILDYGFSEFSLPGVDNVVVNGGANGDRHNVNALGTFFFGPVPLNLTVNAGNGSDTLSVADSDLRMGGFRGNITFNGDGDTDALLLNDDNHDTATTYTINSSLMTHSNGILSVGYNGVESTSLWATGLADTINMNSAFDGWTIRSLGGQDTFNLQGNQVGTFVRYDGGAGLDFVNVNADGIGEAAVRFFNSQELFTLILGSGGTADLQSNANIVVAAVNGFGVGSGSVIDIQDNALIRRSGSGFEGTYRSWINAGFNGGLWNGTSAAIRSSTAAVTPGRGIGYAPGSSSAIASIFGVTVNPTDLLIRYTVSGDTNLDGTVGFADLLSLSQNYNGPGFWRQGDFDYDGTVAFADLLSLSQNYNTSLLTSNQRLAGRFGTSRIARLLDDRNDRLV
jgi:hypothetical protein